MSTSKKKPVTIRFRYNKQTGEVEDLIVDDNAPNAPEEQHDRIAALIASQLGARATIEDAGSIHFESRPATVRDTDQSSAKEKKPMETIPE
jgi:hypothetical protein